MDEFTRKDILDRIAEFVGTDPLQGMHDFCNKPGYDRLNPEDWSRGMVDPEIIEKIKTSQATESLEHVKKFNEMIETQIATENAVMAEKGKNN
jgi:hypothetical protein